MLRCSDTQVGRYLRFAMLHCARACADAGAGAGAWGWGRCGWERVVLYMGKEEEERGERIVGRMGCLLLNGKICRC